MGDAAKLGGQAVRAVVAAFRREAEASLEAQNARFRTQAANADARAEPVSTSIEGESAGSSVT